MGRRLGQHWLKDEAALGRIVKLADIRPGDTVLEIGPGKGALTKHLLSRADRLVAVEYDANLAAELRARFAAPKFELVIGDIRKFNFKVLPADYLVVANIPYYLTSNLIRRLLGSANPPKRAILLVQREVAQRLAAGAGEMSLVALSTQLYAAVSLDAVVTADKFTPRPKVDSQIVIIRRRNRPLCSNPEQVLALARAAFGQRRKKLTNSLKALGYSVEKIAESLRRIDVSRDARPQQLSARLWCRFYQELAN